jgi:membrane-bound lytic murein transglycosylase A
MRLSYAAKSGQAYTGIGGLLVERGVLTREDMSMQSIRTWMRQHPYEARQLMWENKSFVFFREVQLEDPTLGALGAQKVQLTPGRSLAVDRTYWMFGTPVWLETTVPFPAAGKPPTFNGLLIAQDTGTAIRGRARGDVFWGFGADAAEVAGRMKSPGNMTVLLPNSAAKRLRLIP